MTATSDRRAGLDNARIGHCHCRLLRHERSYGIKEEVGTPNGSFMSYCESKCG